MPQTKHIEDVSNTQVDSDLTFWQLSTKFHSSLKQFPPIVNKMVNFFFLYHVFPFFLYDGGLSKKIPNRFVVLE